MSGVVPATGAADHVTLRDGSRIAVRPIVPADKEGLRRAFHRLSPESRYRRFFSPLDDLSDRQLAYLTEIDHADHEALAAIEPASGEILGVARYVRADEPHVAEASVVVGDDWQHRGVASALLERLAARARAAGISHFLAVILSENRSAIELFEHFAPSARRRHDGSGHLELLVALPERQEPISESALAVPLREAARGLVTMSPWQILVAAIQRLPRAGR